MAYDGLDRLTDVASPMYGTAGAHYTYDVLDNLVHTIAVNRDQWLCYDTASNQLTNVKANGDCSTGSTILGLGFDPQGNLANWNGVEYTFDYGNRLRQVEGLESFRYDGHGRRVLATSLQGLGNILSMYGQAGQLLYQQDSRSSQWRDFVYLGGSLVAERAKAFSTGAVTVEYQHTDALGTPVAKTNASRVVVQRSEYEPYGKLLNRPLENGPGYTGHVTDAATQLTYMQQRYYDPRVGRFWSVDPVTVDSVGGNFNRYWYANNNPYRYKDPDGRQTARIHADDTQEERQAALRERKRRESNGRLGSAGSIGVSTSEALNLAGASATSVGTSAAIMEGSVMITQGGFKAAEGARTLEATNVLAKAKIIGRASGLVGGILGGYEAFEGRTTADRAHGALNLTLAGVGLIACNAACGVGLAIYGAADATVQFKTHTDQETGEVTTGWTALWRDIKD